MRGPGSILTWGNIKQWRIQGGAPPVCAPPTDQNFLNFMQFWGKIWQICMLAPPPGGMAPLPTGNPGSASVKASDANTGIIANLVWFVKTPNGHEAASMRRHVSFI